MTDVSALGSILGGPVVGALGGVLGGLFGSNANQQAIGDIQDLAAFNPVGGNIGGAGFTSFNNGQANFRLDPGLQSASQGIQGQLGGLLSGGLAPQVSTGVQLGDLAGSVGQANQALGQAANPFGNQATFANNQANISGLGNMFANNVAAGPQDFSGGQQGFLFGQGNQALQGASNQQGLIQQNLDASRALAQPFENKLINRFNNQEFMSTRGATTGATERQGELAGQLLGADQQRILAAQQLGLQQQGADRQFGLNAMQGGAGLLGQNFNQFNQFSNQALGFGQLGAQLEGQQFGQQLGAQQQNVSQGQSRLQNAMGLLGLQDQLQTSAFGSGLQGLQGLLGIGQLGQSQVLGLLNAEANRIGGTGLHASAISDSAQASGGLLGGLF